MEYRARYKVNRIMHIRPTCEVAKKAQNIVDNNLGLSLTFIGGLTDWRFEEGDLRSMIGILNRGFGVAKDSEIEIIARGNYDEAKLKQFTDEIGAIFSVESDERSMGDILY